MEARRAHEARIRGRVARAAAAAACLPLLGLADCGKQTRQDENEPEGKFQVRVVEASFPKDQRIAKPARLRIAVKNVGDRAIPNIAVTINGFTERIEGEVADPRRPTFLLNGGPVENFGGFKDSKEDTPRGGDTAYVDTWALGRLRPGKTKVFRWSVTPVKDGPFRISWEVNAGLDGKAKAVTSGGQKPKGAFAGTIEGEAPKARVSDDGQSIVQGSR